MDALAKLEAMERAMGEDSSEEELKNMVKAILENKSSMLEVDLRHKGLAPHQIIEIVDSLKQNSTVLSLSLTGNTIDATTMTRLAIMLLENRTISELELDFCELSDDILRILSTALELRKARLVKLTLMGNSTTPRGEADARQYTADGGTKKGAQAPAADSPLALRNNPGARLLIEELVKQNAAMQEQLRLLQGVAEKKSVDDKKKMMDQVKKHHKVKVNLGNLQINELTATGNAMGTSLFSCLVDGWQCSMKEMSLEGVLDQEAKAFDSEIELLEKLPYHPNIAKYLFHLKSDDRIRLFMTKYAVSLREVISTRRAHVSAGTMSYFYPGEVAKWMAQIASGVEFLHKNHVIHRNLKPDVILCTLDTRGYLSNLAITEFDSAKTISKKKQAKTQIGTPSYMSPEVFSSDGSVAYTHKVDVWGIGMILYELITLMVPYEDEDFVKLNSLIPAGKLPSTDHIATDYDSLLTIFRECTQLDPSKRPEIKRIKEQFLQLSVEFDSFEVQPASSSS